MLATMLLALVTGCAGHLGTAPAPPLLGLPLLPDGALVLDGSYRVQVDRLPTTVEAARGAEAAPAARVLILVIRSDVEGFRFEGIDELGLPVLAWPPRADLPPMPIDPGIVARLVQLSLASASDWQQALAGTPWRLDAMASGRRRLSLAEVEHVRVDLPMTLASGTTIRRQRWCPEGFARDGACASGDGLAIEVSDIVEGDGR